ncbi:MAG: hypothetical protein IPP79_18765 [Chitinophagaceae bacterium]|nr:hypothetical protein [Chitinophagaceae bacterium]
MRTRDTRFTGISRFADPLCLLRSHHHKIHNSIRKTSLWFFVLVTVLLTIGTEASATKYFISPTGNDANAGTIGAPFATLNKAWTLVAAGDTVYLRGGTYYFNSEQLLINKNGTATNLIKVWNYPGENPIIKKGTITSWTYYSGILVMGDYIHVKGLEITGWKQETADHLYYGFMAQNVQNCTFELLNIHHNGFGLCIGDWSTHYSTNVTVLNCDLHHNSDPYTAYGTNTAWGGADGLRVSTVDPNGVFNIIGTRMWWNSDDGVDLYNNNGFLTFTNCWNWMNGYRPGYTTTDPDLTVAGGNGIGFKVGPPVNDYSTVTKRVIKNCLATYNRSIGFDQNLGKLKVELYNNTACYNARGYGFNYLLELHIPHVRKITFHMEMSIV